MSLPSGLMEVWDNEDVRSHVIELGLVNVKELPEELWPEEVLADSEEESDGNYSDDYSDEFDEEEEEEEEEDEEEAEETSEDELPLPPKRKHASDKKKDEGPVSKKHKSK